MTKLLQHLSSLVLIFILVSIGSCTNDNFPKYVALGGLRILAIRADQGSQFSGVAEFSVGDTVVMTPYISYYSVTSAVSYSASACIDSGVNYGAEPTCVGVPGAVTIGSGAVTLTGGVTNTGAAPALTLTIPSTLLVSRSAVDQYNGVNYLFVYKLTSTDGGSVSSFKRLPVSSASKTKNQNPTLTSLTANGATLASMPTAAASIAANFTAGSRESYSAMRSDGTLVSSVEDMTTTYFVTDGSLKYFRTVNSQSTTYTPPSPTPTDHTPIIVGVTRDARGGVSVKIHSL
jgi:hypothetical protein